MNKEKGMVYRIGIAIFIFVIFNPLSSIVEAQSESPNILFIYVDDQAHWAYGITGNDELKTPNIDKIGEEGAFLPNFFTTTPVCSPSRASLITGKYGSEVGITDWISPPQTSSYNPEPEVGLSSEFATWVNILNKSGYRTGLIGKWHLGIQPEHHPINFGYDTFMGFLEGGSVPKDPVLEENGKTKQFKGFTTNIFTDKAIDFMQNASRPFMLSLHYRAPHLRWLPLPEEDWEPYKNAPITIPHPYYPDLDKEEVRRRTREYYGAITSIDRNVGRILEFLESEGIDKNTIVVYTSDHGYNIGHNGIRHKGNGHWILNHEPPVEGNMLLANQRPNMWDNSLRVPALIRWPEVIEPGTVVDETISVLDWFPTLVAMGDAKVPESLKLQGRNFLPLLKGGDIEDWDNDFYAEYSTHHQSLTHMRAYRTDQWKLVLDLLNPDRNELYNLVEDPEETENVINKPELQNVVGNLRQKIMDQMKKNNDPVFDDEGFVQIFDGNSLDGWKGDPTYWRVEDGKLVGEVTPETILDRNTFIIWQGDMPSDFELKVEYRISAEGNSGINYRSEMVEGVPYALRGYQADLNGPELSYGKFTGSNYEERGRTTLASQGEKVVLPPVENADSLELYKKKNFWTARKVVESLGTPKSLQTKINKGWNEYHLVVKGNRMKHYVNGILISDVTDRDAVNRRFDGLLGVQVHTGPPMKVEFRDIRLKKLYD